MHLGEVAEFKFDTQYAIGMDALEPKVQMNSTPRNKQAAQESNFTLTVALKRVRRQVRMCLSVRVGVFCACVEVCGSVSFSLDLSTSLSRPVFSTCFLDLSLAPVCVRKGEANGLPCTFQRDQTRLAPFRFFFLFLFCKGDAGTFEGRDARVQRRMELKAQAAVLFKVSGMKVDSLFPGATL